MNRPSHSAISLRNLFVVQSLLLAGLLGTAGGQSFIVNNAQRQVKASVVANVDDLGYWRGPPANTNCVQTNGSFTQQFSITIPSTNISFASTVFQTSNITAGDGTLTISGRFTVTNAYTGSTNRGGANWDLLASLDLHFTAAQPFSYALSVTNFHTPDGGVAGYDSFVGLTDAAGTNVAAFGESTYWYYLNLTNSPSGSQSGLLPAGTYRLRSIAADGLIYGGVLEHTANRTTAFTFNATSATVALKIARAGGGVILSWPAFASDYGLQTRDTSGGTWAVVTNTPVPVGNELQVMLAPATGSRLFRLAK